MTLIEKLQRLPRVELDIIEELFASITHGAVCDIYRDLMHSRSECILGADVFMKVQEMDDATYPEPTTEHVDLLGRSDWLSDTWMLRLAYLALCENEHVTVPGHPDCPPPFNEPYDTTKLLQMMEKQRIHDYTVTMDTDIEPTCPVGEARDNMAVRLTVLVEELQDYLGRDFGSEDPDLKACKYLKKMNEIKNNQD
jgi:hypothetical protein